MRDLFGYGPTPPDPQWPGGARVAVQLVLNIEAGAERTPLNGDSESENHLLEFPAPKPRPGRHPTAESLFEYGARAGVWRLLRVIERHQLPLTAFACGLAIEQQPALGAALRDLGVEVAGHGYRWIDYSKIPEEVERQHIRRTVTAIERHCGERPRGWYIGRVSPNTRRLLIEEGGFEYDSDSYADDLPYWHPTVSPPWMIIPYALDTNDARFVVPPGFSGGADFGTYLIDTLEYLRTDAPSMMSVGLHGRFSGHPGRTAGLARFLDHLTRCPDVWVASRLEIARHWARTHAPTGR